MTGWKPEATHWNAPRRQQGGLKNPADPSDTVCSDDIPWWDGLR